MKEIEAAITRLKVFAYNPKIKLYNGLFDDLNVVVKAAEKQISKKIENWNGQASCPDCKKLFGNISDIRKLKAWDMPHCKWCGQKIDWSE